jgi:hypothetical protein
LDSTIWADCGRLASAAVLFWLALVNGVMVEVMVKVM